MSRPVLPPRIIKRGKTPYLRYTNRLTGEIVRKSCAKLGAHTAEARAELLALYKRKDSLAFADSLRLGADADYGKPLSEALNLYLADVKRRADLRRINKAREGLAARSAKRLHETINAFLAFIPKGMKTGDLDRSTLDKFFNGIAERAASGTVNLHKSNLSACLNWLDDIRPRLFSDAAAFRKALKKSRVIHRRAEALKPSELRAFCDALPVRARRLFKVCALTGCRLGEALALRWEDVDFSRGWVWFKDDETITGKTRWIPLTGAKEGEVAPNFLKELATWDHIGDRVCALSRFPQRSWHNAGRIRPQMLRRNFVSYAASLGFPVGTTALWCGHGLEVVQRYYLEQLPERLAATSLEAAMGF